MQLAGKKREGKQRGFDAFIKSIIVEKKAKKNPKEDKLAKANKNNTNTIAESSAGAMTDSGLMQLLQGTNVTEEKTKSRQSDLVKGIGLGFEKASAKGANVLTEL